MTTITLEGKEYQLDIEQAKKLNLLKEKSNRVKSWEEFKEKYRDKYGYFYEAHSNKALRTSSPISIGDQLTSNEAKALAAFSKLLRLRRDWIGEWEPDFTRSGIHWALYCRSNNVVCDWCERLSHVLSFPTEQMAQEFLDTFRDLIEEAKILI